MWVLAAVSEELVEDAGDHNTEENISS